MAGHDFLPTSRQIWAPGNVDVKYGPFNSISEFKTWYESELGELYRGITVGIIQQNGTIKEYWNGDSASVNEFILKNGGETITTDAIPTAESTNPVQSGGVYSALENKADSTHTHTANQISGLADVAKSGSYDDLVDKPTIPAVNDSEIVFTHDGKEVGRMTTNQSAGKTIEVGEGEERVFTAAFLKKVLTCRMNKEVYLTSGAVVSPNMVKYNGLPEPGSSSTAWCGAGVEPTAAANTRIIIHNVNVDAWKGRTFTLTVKEGMEFAIASGEVIQNSQWDKSYPQTSDIAWNWHTHSDPVTIEIKDMISIMFRNAGNGTFNWAYSYTAMWEWFEIEEETDTSVVKIPPRKLKDDRYVGYRVGVLGDSILAGASTKAYKTALDVLVSDYGIVPVPRCIAGSCIAPTSAAYSRDDIRFKNRVELNWQFTSLGYNGAENGVNRPYDKSLGVLIYCVNDVLMDKVKLDANAFVLVTDQATGCQEWQIDNTALDAEGYVASLIELEGIIKSGAGSSLNHFFLVGPYKCTWPGAYPMSTTGVNPNGNTGEDYIRAQRKLAMIKGWSYLDLLSSQLNTSYTAMSNDRLHLSQEGHQLLGDILGQMLCGTLLTQASDIFSNVDAYTARNKKWAVIGDSLTARTSYTTKAYHDYIAEQMGVNVINLGVGGTGYWKGYEDLNNFALKVGDIPEDTDFITVFGSFNDIASLDLEEYEASIGNVGSAGYTTICGAINEFFDELYARFPACKVGVILPTPWKTMTPIYTDAPAWDYVEKLRTICERKGVPVLDLFKGSGLRPWDSANRLAMYSKDLESGQTDPRGTHPNEAGHYVIASKIREFIKSLI